MDSDPYRVLAAAVIHQAKHDLYTKAGQKDAIEFFYSDWFAELCGICDVSPEYVRKCVRVGDPVYIQRRIRKTIFVDFGKH